MECEGIKRTKMYCLLYGFNDTYEMNPLLVSGYAKQQFVLLIKLHLALYHILMFDLLFVWYICFDR